MIDLDHFKDINDTYGHHVGDQIIKKFIKICSLEIRSVDTIGRLGGEEFAIILPNCSETIGLNCAERIRISAQNSILKLDKGEQVKFSASFGVALFEKNDDAESILKKADKALYNAKETGRNKTVLYSKIRKG